MAAQGGLHALALTDHDLPPALPQGAARAAGRPIWVVHGVEISTEHRGTEQHLLVWFRGEMPAAFASFCRELCRARAARYGAAVEAIGLGLAPPGPEALAGERSLTRYHLASALVAGGHAPGLGEAFARWAGEGCGFVPPIGLTLARAIAEARDAGGYTAWAHPDPALVPVWVAELAAAGLHALEVHRPGLNRGHRDRLARLAFNHGLGVTGGSDWHGWAGGALGAFSLARTGVEDAAVALGLA